MEWVEEENKVPTLLCSSCSVDIFGALQNMEWVEEEEQSDVDVFAIRNVLVFAICCWCLCVCVVDFCGGHLLMVVLLKSVDVFATSTHCPFAKI